jgi:hypothetical protein
MPCRAGLIQFDIAADGRAKRITVLSSEPKGVFGKSSSELVSTQEFEVPGGWAGTELSKHHYTLSIIYSFTPCASPTSRGGIEGYPADGAATITVQKLAALPRSQAMPALI